MQCKKARLAQTWEMDNDYLGEQCQLDPIRQVPPQLNLNEQVYIWGKYDEKVNVGDIPEVISVANTKETKFL